MHKLFFYILFCSLAAHTAQAQTPSLSLITNYPVPLGEYTQITLVPRNTIGSGLNTACPIAGTFYVNQEIAAVDQVLFCGHNPAGDLVWVTLPGTWAQGEDLSGQKFFHLEDTEAFVGIGTADPLAKLHVHNGAFLVNGTTGPVPASGPGTRLMVSPEKSAFRAGAVSGTQWDNAQIGQASIALGRDTIASGAYSAAFGNATTASGQDSIAMGSSTLAAGTQSLTLGQTTSASGTVAIAMGDQTTASGDHSIAMGYLTQASGDASISMGSQSTASDTSSITLGRWLNASAEHSMILGKGTADAARLTNNIPHSLMIGFSSSPAFFADETRVGINTTNPGSRLSINGNISIGTGMPAAPADGILIAGAVGIGTPDPATALDVNGTVRAAAPSLPACPGTDNIQGAIIYNTTGGTLHGCTATGWQILKTVN